MVFIEWQSYLVYVPMHVSPYTMELSIVDLNA